MISSLLPMTLLLLPFLASCLSINEPASGVLFAVWLDTTDSSVGANDGDRPVKFNARMGFNASVFQYGQDLPIPAGSFTFPQDQIWATGTDAQVFLTVYPRPSPWTILDIDIKALTTQCGALNQAGRKVFLRFGPEMNGNWNYWGQQPTQFLALWKRLATQLRLDAPQTALVWAPSSGNGYPYGTPKPSPADLLLLDTNKDGVVDDLDDPYLPYYPGDDLVDWVGMSIYHYGSKYPWIDNVIAKPGEFESYLNDHGFYQTYAALKNQPFMLSESAAAFHTNTPKGQGAGELAIKQSWWTQYLTNVSFLQAYPLFKLQCLFEFNKPEETLPSGQPDIRDFRISWNDSIRSAFLSDWQGAQSNYIYGNYVSNPVNYTTPPAPPTNGAIGISHLWVPFLLSLFSLMMFV